MTAAPSTGNGVLAPGRFAEVTADAPCPACGKNDYCSASEDGGSVCCRRTCDSPADPGYECKGERPDRNGGTFTLWRRISEKQGGRTPAIHRPIPGAKAADADTLHEVYSAFLSHYSSTSRPKMARDAA
jgi:hypothetical protein